MGEIYRITIHGRTLESKDLRRLLARAVTEKRSVDRRRRVLAGIRQPLRTGLLELSLRSSVSADGSGT